jgi:hypothetical protein
LLAIFNMAWSLTEQAAVGDLSAPVSSAQMLFASGFLASKVFAQITTSGLVRVDMQINALVADPDLVGHLLGTPFNTKEESHIGPDLRTHAAGIAAGGAAVSSQKSGDLIDGLFGFQ